MLYAAGGQLFAEWLLDAGIKRGADHNYRQAQLQSLRSRRTARSRRAVKIDSPLHPRIETDVAGQRYEVWRGASPSIARQLGFTELQEVDSRLFKNVKVPVFCIPRQSWFGHSAA